MPIESFDTVDTEGIRIVTSKKKKNGKKLPTPYDKINNASIVITILRKKKKKKNEGKSKKKR